MVTWNWPTPAPAMLVVWELYLVCDHMELATLAPAMLVVWELYLVCGHMELAYSCSCHTSSMGTLFSVWSHGIGLLLLLPY